MLRPIQSPGLHQPVTTRNDLLKKFSDSFEKAIESRFPGQTISAAYLANQFNLRCAFPDQVSRETVRQWMRGLRFPELMHQLVLFRWLGVDFNQIFDCAESMAQRQLSPTFLCDNCVLYKKNIELNTIFAQLRSVLLDKFGKK